MAMLHPEDEPAICELVQHCNPRTEYELIKHPYEPDACTECQIIREIFRRQFGN
jgi:hypothetical protein